MGQNKIVRKLNRELRQKYLNEGIEPTHKYCSVCNELKTLSEFCKSTELFGVEIKCKLCKNKTTKTVSQNMKIIKLNKSIRNMCLTNNTNQTHKYCSKCELLKPFDEFHKDSTNITGVTSKCKFCKREYCDETSINRHEYYIKNNSSEPVEVAITLEHMEQKQIFTSAFGGRSSL